MCWWIKKDKIPEGTPDWITHTKKEVAQAELEAASTHYSWMIGIVEGRITEAQQKVGGNYARHAEWYQWHMEAAYYCDPTCI